MLELVAGLLFGGGAVFVVAVIHHAIYRRALRSSGEDYAREPVEIAGRYFYIVPVVDYVQMENRATPAAYAGMGRSEPWWRDQADLDWSGASGTPLRPGS